MESVSLWVSIYVCVCRCQPHAKAVCQGLAPDGSEGRFVFHRALPGSSAPSRAPHCPTEGYTLSVRNTRPQSEVEGQSGSSLFGH